MATVLTTCPVRKRYAYQLVRYGPLLARWLARLRAGARGETVPTLLLDLLARAQAGTAHYARAFAEAGIHARELRGPSELSHLPALSRTKLQTAYYDLFDASVRERHVNEGWLGTTSGSTGEPVRFFMDGGSIHLFTGFVRFLFGWYQLGPLHFDEPAAEATLTRLAPAVITGDPGSLAALADACEAGLSVAPRLILSSAFPLSGTLAERLARLTSATVVDTWSMAEMGPVAWRCPRSRRWHLLEGAVEAESVASELLVTNLRNSLFPLIRYRTGDLGEVARRPPCACGFAGRDLERLEGRVASRFVAASGARVDPGQLQPLLSRLPVRQFQLIQSQGEVLLRYCADRPVESGALPTLQAALEALLGGPLLLRSEHSLDPLFRLGEKPLVYRSRITAAESSGSASSG
jgi:phenylacetate-coenzyme A ligase PaaK-like adenylate-forming protein